jgi:hypothetical protein
MIVLQVFGYTKITSMKLRIGQLLVLASNAMFHFGKNIPKE